MQSTYADVLAAQRDQHTRVLQRFVLTEGTVERTGAQVLEVAQERGSALLKFGLGSGQRVALLVSSPAEFLPLLHGCLLYGLVPVPFYPPPLFGKRETYQATLDSVLAAADVQAVVVDDGELARWGTTFSARSMVEVSSLPAAQIQARPVLAPTQLALLQFTSGSTKAPRGVCVTHAALLANAHAIMRDGLAATSNDHGVCWLPLYHDMGLVGFGLAPLLTRTPVTFIPTSRFVRNPSIWLQTLHEQRGTITFAPNFAYALATKRATVKDLDLSCVRMWGCGAEPIAEQTLAAFEAHFASSGVAPSSIAPCYGLAEATLAVTFTPPSSHRTVDHVERDAWTDSGVAVSAPVTKNTLAVVSCGKPLPGYDVTIMDEEGRAMQDGAIGEVVVRGPSVAPGYHNEHESTALTFRNGALHTGDRGYVKDGELFVAGRIKDTVILNGRKYDPHVFEQVLETAPGVRRAVAVNVTSTEGDVLAVVVERALEPNQTDDSLKATTRTTLAAHFGVQTASVTCVAPGTLPRTTSGKLQRNKVHALIERE